MDTSPIEHDTKTMQDAAIRLTAPFQTLWKVTLFDLPLAVLSESLRFTGRRLQAHADHLESLNSCQSVPEIIEAQSHFVRGAVSEFGQDTGKIMEDVRGTMNEAQDKFSKAA
jgi:hypothetical protein